GDPALEREVAPAVAARFAGRRGVVELPDFLASLRVVRRDEAAGARLAGAAADHLALDHDRSRGVLGQLLVILDLAFPSQLAGTRIERHQEAAGSVEIDHLPIDGHALLPRGGPRPAQHGPALGTDPALIPA